MKIVFIVNPIAGKMSYSQKVSNIQKYMSEKNIQYKILRTTNPSNAKALAIKATELKADITFAVGGDGTVNEVGSGMVGTGSVMGILPCGSGNDFAKMLKIPLTIEDALDHALSAQPSTIDTIKLNGEDFINISSIGVDASTVHLASKLKRYFGGLSYLIALTVCLAKLKYRNIDIEIDGVKKSGKFLLSAIANGKQYGGLFKIAPNALPNDGQIDVCTISKIPKLYSLVIFPTVIFGNHTSIKQVTMSKAKEVTISYEGEAAINIDGNIHMMSAPLNFKINPKSLKILY